MTGLVAIVGVTIAALSDLTIPTNRLPAGCAPPPSAVERENGNRLRGGLWAGLPIAGNPAISSEPKLIVEVRERLGGAPLIPDPPALTARDAARFRLHLAEGIDEAYAAIYRGTDSAALIVVYGLRFPNARDAADFWAGARAAKNPAVAAVVSDAIVAAVSAPSGACRDAVVAHLNSLRDRAPELRRHEEYEANENPFL